MTQYWRARASPSGDRQAGELEYPAHALPGRRSAGARDGNRSVPAAGPAGCALLRRRGEPLDDIVQAASVGLIKAVDRYSPERGDAFAAYARPMIAGEIRRHFRDTTWGVHVPRPLKERAGRVARAKTEVASRSGSGANREAVAKYLDLEPQEVAEAECVLTAYWPASLDAPALARDGDGVLRQEVLASPESPYESVEVSIEIGRALRGLRRRDQTVLLLRLCCELSQDEIAGRIGVSQMHVSRILRSANLAISAACGLGMPA